MKTPAISGSRQGDTLLSGERRALELIAIGTPLQKTLDALCRVIDDASGLMSSIAGMQERLKQLGGTVEIRSRGEGTLVRAALPLHTP